MYCNRPLVPDAQTSSPSVRPLPTALREKFQLIEVFAAFGAEADIMLVADMKSGERRVAKLYRQGIRPDFKLLEILAKTVGDSVVRVLDFGVSDGVAYELLEYVPHGTLQELLRSGPVATDNVRRIVAEIADALNGIHAHRILHRDLKPENVLLRSKSPLELALTDFGIASISAATQLFTSGARTTRYAAPEMLTGVIDQKSDWWSLGMIALEAATGRHPFDGLSEQVMNHHLATKPIDVRGVYDDSLRALCRGLLLRDPKRRWGAAEVERWLAGDTTLQAPEDSEGAVSTVRPYRIGATESTTAGELALALAKNWQEARKDLARGQIARWIESELRDYNLLRKLKDIEDYRGVSEDMRLLRFLLAAAPDLPPVWQGLPVSRATLLAFGRRAEGADDEAKTWLESLFKEEVLAQFAAAGNKELAEIDRHWRQNWKRFHELWQVGRSAAEAWGKQPRPVAALASAEVVSFDDLVFTQAARFAPPSPRTLHGALLLAYFAPEYIETLRPEVIGSLAKVAGYSSWIETLWREVQADAVGIIVTQRIMPRAREDADLEARRQTASKDARSRIVGDAESELRERVSALIAIAPDDDHDLDRDTVSQLLDALTPFQEACQRVAALGYTEPEYDTLRRNAETLSAYGSSLQHELVRCERVMGVNAIFMRPERVAMGAGVILLVLVLLHSPAAMLVVLIGVLAWGGHRWHAGFSATGDALKKLALLRRYAINFLRKPGEPA